MTGGDGRWPDERAYPVARNASPATAPDQWGVRWRPVTNPRLRLFCLPHSGGGAATYRPWASLLSPDIDVVAIRPPGRETRFREPPFSRISDLVPVLVRSLEPLLDRPHAWFGHSMGALVAFEACRAMRRYGLVEPRRLMVSGRPAPHLAPRDRSIYDSSDAEFMSRLTQLNGTPLEVGDDRSALSTFVPTLRADFAMVESYRYHHEPPLDYPISVFGGTEDRVVALEELDGWRSHSAVKCDVRLFPGDHFFLHQAREKFVAAVTADLMSS
jgi:medium-chain acyl-[acyl-carrier-protein] hydrolase